MTDLHIFLTVLVIAAVTILTRVLPFAVFPENKKTPDFILYLGRVLPYSIMGMLVVYCFKSVSVTAQSIRPSGIVIRCFRGTGA